MAAVTVHHWDPEDHPNVFSKTLFGFWAYLMSDCILFATLFASYAVLHTSTFGGPTSKELFSLPHALNETLVLLTSSFTCGLAMLAVHRKKLVLTIAFFCLTFALGLLFLGLELKEFAELVEGGNSWERNAFLSAYFTLVSTHGLHISVGLLWIFILMAQLVYFGLNSMTVRRLTMLSLFWHFLDIVWIFIFSIVYLMGAT